MNELLEQPPLTLDECEARIANLVPIECPVVHRFTPGLYIREILLPAGTILTSKIHNTEHPYTISKGRCCVFTENDGTFNLEAPYTGITKPGTRRMIFAYEDTIWTTYHPTNKTTPEEVEEEIIMKHTNPLLQNKEQPCLG